MHSGKQKMSISSLHTCKDCLFYKAEKSKPFNVLILLREETGFQGWKPRSRYKQFSKHLKYVGGIRVSANFWNRLSALGGALGYE